MAGRRPGWLLAAVESARVLRDAPSLALALVCPLLSVLRTWGRVPVLHQLDDTTVIVVLPLAVHAAIAANRAVLRDRRDGVDEFLTSLPLRRAQRVAAHLVAATAPALLAMAVVLAELLLFQALGAIGRPDPFLLARAPLVVAVAGQLGVLAGLLSRWRSAVLLPGAAAAAVLLLFPVPAGGELVGGGWLRDWWLAAGGDLPPWIDWWSVDAARGVSEDVGLPPDPGPLVTVLAAGAATVAAALGIAGGAGRHVAGWVAWALVLGLVAGTDAGGADAAARLRARVGDPSLARCEYREGIRYCAYPAYRPWIDEWHTAVGGVVRALPPGSPAPTVHQLHVADPRAVGLSVRDADLLAAQRERVAGIHPVLPWLAWGRGAPRGEARLAVAAAAAAAAVGLPASPRPLSVADSRRTGRWYASCSATGQAREVVALWLAGQSSPEARRALGRAALAPGVLTRLSSGDAWRLDTTSRVSVLAGRYLAFGPGVDWDPGAVRLAVRLLDRPDAQVRTALHRHWDRLTAVSATPRDLWQVVSLPDPPAPAPVPADGDRCR